MKEVLLSNESLLRLAAFAGVLAAMAVWESLAPRRRQEIGRSWRWPNNLAVIAIDTLLVRLVFPITAVGFAALAESRGWGLLQALSVPSWLAVLLAVLLLDLAIYLQHAAFHAVPVLWRLHRMHHADLEFDVTTGIRFHPIEILLSMGIKLAVIAALGAPAAGVFLFEVLLNATSLFNHCNVRLPVPLMVRCAGSSSRRTCTGYIIRSRAPRPTAISASTCHGGIACSGSTGISRRAAMRR